MRIRAAWLLASAILLAGALAPSAQADEQPLRLLIVDETRDVAGSLQVNALARALNETGRFALSGVTGVPDEPNDAEPAFDLVLIVPAHVDQVWVIAPDLPDRLPAALAEGARRLRQLATERYERSDARSPRTVVGVQDDVVPALYGSWLLRLGWLEPAGGGDDT